MKENNGSSSIIRNLQVVFSASIILLVISLIASFYSIRKLIRSADMVQHTNEVMIELESIYSTIKEGESSQRGYIISGNISFLEIYEASHEKVLEHYRKVKVLTSDNPVQQENITVVKSYIDDRYAQMDRVLTLSASRSLSDFEARQEIVRGKRIMEDLRSMIERMKQEEERLMIIRTEKQKTFVKYTPVLVIAAAIISILITISSYVRIRADMNRRIARQQEDERKYHETAARIGVMEDVTRKIARGDYKVRSADESEDELGRISAALNEMAAALDRSFTDMQRRNWLREGAMAVSEAIRSDRAVEKLSENLITSIARYMGAPVGTLYIKEAQGDYRLAGHFAADRAPEYVVEGKGLTGAALRRKELLVVNELPENYTNVSSSIGATLPVSAMIMPLLFRGQPIGVIELGMLHQPEEHEMEFLQGNAEAMSIGINAALEYRHLQDLLEETQAQSEELQAQHSTLENLNAELEAQTQKLQASEEELRVQQEELQQTNGELEERTLMLQEKNEEVRRKAKELEQTTRYKSEFLANMSHELRTPLNSILLLSRLLSENNDKNLSGDQIEYARVIQTSGNSLLNLIDEILDLSKIEAGKMQMEYEEIRVAEIVHDVQALFDPVAQERGLAFSVSVQQDVPDMMETDKMKLEQVLKNLISNALKFTAKGSVELTIKRAAGKENMLSFSVKDTGIGIPKDKQGLIFEAFQQADGSTRRKYGGTGLGLSISRELIRLLGGSIRLASEENAGSEFTVLVPLTRPAQDFNGEDEEQNAVETESGDKERAADIPDKYLASSIPAAVSDDRDSITPKDKTILIVEDDTDFARTLLDFTRRKGYKGIVAVRGDEGMELARKYNPSGILLDVQLPVKSGWDVLEDLKSNPRTRHIPVHIMSSYEVKKESLLKGAVNFVNKPVDLEHMQEIFRKIEYVLNKNPKKVLIVEENTKHAEALAYFLQSFRIQSEVKNNINESVEALTQGEADCVILDMGIPTSRTYDTLEEIKKNPELENLPIIIFTGKSLSLTEEQRIRKYADSIIVKTAHSYQRMLDEVSLFLHVMEEKRQTAGAGDFRKLGAMDQVLYNKTVLIVDDDVRNIFSITKALEGLKMNIVTATDGKEAMQKLAGNPGIDIVLLDMMMPEMDGYETAAQIRKKPEWKDLPIIAVTAKAMTGDREKCINAGASDYITKPVDLDQLLSLLRVWLYERY